VGWASKRTKKKKKKKKKKEKKRNNKTVRALKIRGISPIHPGGEKFKPYEE
jgi:hypothetical protein